MRLPRLLRQLLAPVPAAPARAVAQPPKRAALRVSDEVVARSRIVKGAPNPFAVAQHPPGVLPSSDVAMAMDDAITAAGSWAAGATLEGIAGEGIHFLGFPYLAELAQRPEYRRISETIATEMTRRWIKLTAAGDEDKTDRIAAINAALDRFSVQDLFRRVAEQDGFFGRAHLYIDLGKDDPDELKTAIGDGKDRASQAKVAKGSLKGFRTVEALWCYPAGYNTTNPLGGDWYKPATWYVQGRQVHATRLLTFVGREVPDLLKPAYSFGGLSMSQVAKPYVDNWLRTRESVADLISSFSVSGIKIGLADALAANGDELFRRIDLFNNLRDNRGTMVLNKGTGGDGAEEFFNVSTPLGTLDHLQAQAQEHMASVSGIPLVKLLGVTPSGLNASSDGEIRVFYDYIHAYQAKFFAANLRCVLNFVQLSEFGEVDPDIGFIFEPLWSLDEKDRAEVRRIEAETDKALVDGQIISRGESRKRLASDPDAPYAGLDLAGTPPLTEAAVVDLGTKKATVILGASESGLIGDAVALKGLRATGLFPDISDQDIAEAEAEPPTPEGELLAVPGTTDVIKREVSA